MMTYMLGNIMFYGIDIEPGEQKMDMGPITITWTELRIGRMSYLMSCITITVKSDPFLVTVFYQVYKPVY